MHERSIVWDTFIGRCLMSSILHCGDRGKCLDYGLGEALGLRILAPVAIRETWIENKSASTWLIQRASADDPVAPSIIERFVD
jgi:hypothetical protein